MLKQSETFLNSVERSFDEAADIIGLNDSLKYKIKVANSTYVVRFGVRLRNKLSFVSLWMRRFTKMNAVL